MGIIIKSIEYYLPDRIITNEDLQKENPQWNMNNVISFLGHGLRPSISSVDRHT